MVRAVCLSDTHMRWGSPITPAFRRMAFNRERGSEIAAHWARIPAGLDLLITHGPPRGLGDRMVLGTRFIHRLKAAAVISKSFRPRKRNAGSRRSAQAMSRCGTL